MQNNIIYLVDGSSLVYRSFYAITLSTSKGFPTGAIYGFFNTLKKIIQKYNTEFMCVCFDVSRKTFRQEKFKDYKIKRPPVPEALKLQIPLIKKLINYLGVNIVEKEGYEADDLIASLAVKALRSGFRVIIISLDKDVYQLIDDDLIKVYNPFKDKLYNQDCFIEEFNFSPELIIDYLALVGDNVDNIPGAKGIGKVGAQKLIKKFNTVEDLFNNLNCVSPKIKEILNKNKDIIFLSKELVKLDDSLELDLGWDDFKLRAPDYQNIYKLCRDLEFKSLLKSIPQPNFNIKIETRDGIPQKIIEKIRNKKVLCFYLNRDFCFVFDEDANFTYKVRSIEIRELLEDDQIKKISYDFKEELIKLNSLVNLKGLWFDTKIAGYLANPSLGDYTMENLCANFLNLYIKDIPDDSYPYFIFQLYRVLKEEIEKNNLQDLLFQIEIPLIPVLAMMESRGLNIDREALEKLIEEVNNKIEDLSRDIFKISKSRFNLNSPQQLRKILFEDLKLPPVKKIKTGFSTDEEVLQKLALNFPIAKLLLDYRQSSKLKSTYLIPFIEEVEAHKGRLHTKFNQTQTQTGRLSSSSPNLQNIPIKGFFLQKIRRLFIPSFDDGFILSSDYSQIELRVLAHFSQEKNLMEAFKNNLDIHISTASLLFGIPQDKVNKHQREIAKRVNFGIIYGMSSYGLAKELNIGEEEARSFIDNYFLRYPKVREFIERTVEEAKKTGFVKTLMGRIRYLPDINSSNNDLREFACRQAINTPIQGTAADIIKLAMIKIFSEFEREQIKSRLILQIHDELVFDVSRKELKKVVDIVKINMENSINLNVPILANLKIGRNWLEMEQL